jgi:hypothetical protein
MNGVHILVSDSATYSWFGTRNMYNQATLDVSYSSFQSMETPSLILNVNIQTGTQVHGTIHDSIYRYNQVSTSRGGSIIASRLQNLTIEKVIFTNNQALSGFDFPPSPIHPSTAIHVFYILQSMSYYYANPIGASITAMSTPLRLRRSRFEDNIGDGNVLAISGAITNTDTDVDATNDILCGDGVCVAIDGNLPVQFPKDTLWQCKPGSPWLVLCSLFRLILLIDQCYELL